MELVFSAVMITTAVRPRTGTWELDWEMPDEWPLLVRELNGGFFHTPSGLRVGAPAGDPVYARCLADDLTIAIALGVRSQCRLSARARHVYFPAAPAMREGVDRREIRIRLARRMREDGIAEVTWDSFDSGCFDLPAATPTRWEYVLELATVGDGAEWPGSQLHRRCVRRGDRSGWELVGLHGPAARTTLSTVTAGATERAEEKGAGFESVIPPIVDDPPASTEEWGATTYQARDEDGLLAAVLVGQTTDRAYYLMGGATERGYTLGASHWLQARLARRFADHGLRHYNLGGAPFTAPEPTDRAHGLHRFKTGFGATVVGCAGDRWVLAPNHHRGHRFLAWATAWAR